MPAKLDLHQTHKKEYATPREPVLLEVSPARYLAVAGAGAPGTPEFVEAIGALYAVAFTIRTPDFVTSADVEGTSRELRAKGKPRAVETVRANSPLLR